jgi:RimJ/RimL family protein N-acetyltransferase
LSEPLLGPRVRLRPLVVDDAARMAALLEDDPEATAMTARIPIPCTADAARAWIEVAAVAPAYTFAIERRADATMMGAVGFVLLPAAAGLGYWLGRPFWGQGLATEAAALALDHARSLGATRAEAETFPENLASARVLAKLGFRVIGEVARMLPRRGGPRRLVQHECDLLTWAVATASARG